MELFPISALKDNYIWTLVDTVKKHAVVVDPGAAAPVIDTLQARGLRLAGILVTHHHWDHTNGIGELLDYAGAIPVVGSHESRNEFVNHHVKDGEEITLSHVHCRAIAVPGHTLDHTAYYDAHTPFLFTGDTLFSAGCGRIFEGTAEMMYASLQKIAALPDDVKVYCGHEYTRKNLQFAEIVEPENQEIRRKLSSLQECTLPSTMAEEKLINPFLRCTKESVLRAAEAYAKVKLSRPVEVFAVLREWKNNY
jgi:hydroxyacylglutathione hydrolase